MNGGFIEELPELIEDGYYLYISGGNVLIRFQNERGAMYKSFQ
jgi:hypothetical protein